MISLPHSPNVLTAESLQQKNKRLVLHAPAAKKTCFNHFHFQENRNLMNSSSETPPSPLMSSASKSSLARRRGSNLAQSRSGSRTWFLNYICNIWWEAKLSLLFFFIVVYCVDMWPPPMLGWGLDSPKTLLSRDLTSFLRGRTFKTFKKRVFNIINLLHIIGSLAAIVG